MSYNTELQANNAELQELIDAANALPEMPDTVAQATPEISVDAAGLITAEAVQTAGYVAAGTASATRQLPTQPGATVTPGAEEQTVVEAGTFVTGDIMVAAVDTSGGDTSAEDSIIDRTLDGEYVNDRVASIGGYAFYGCESLLAADFPNATSIGTYAFQNCTALQAVDFPSTTSISTSAFEGCTALQAANFPNATSTGNYAFRSCAALQEANFKSAASVGTGAFQSCESLQAANFPNATSIGNYAFASCAELPLADFPAATRIGTSAFQYCTALQAADFPAATSIGNYAFRSCAALTLADFPAATSIGTYVFNGCSALTALVLRRIGVATTSGTAPCTLSNTNAFTNTPIASGTGYIYVPRADVSAYRNATNWSTYADQFRAIEDYTVDGTLEGELDLEKMGVVL